MHSRIITISIILLMQLVYNLLPAQDFYPLRGNEKTYFRSSSGEYIGAIYDSVVTHNDTTFYYNYPIAKEIDGCIRMKRASWMGAEVFVSNDILHIISQWSDTLIIKYNAEVGEYWQLHKESPSKFILALVNGLQIRNTLAVKDTIKTISFTAVGYSGTQKDLIESRSIKIGTAFGLTDVFDFFSFPRFWFLNVFGSNYTIEGQGEYGIKPVTMAEVMDLHTGEIFHYFEYREVKPHSRKERKEINKIIDRQVNTSGDTLTLQTERIIQITDFTFDDNLTLLPEKTQMLHDTIMKSYDLSFREPLEPVMKSNGDYTAYSKYDCSGYMDRRMIYTDWNYNHTEESDCFDIWVVNGYKALYYVEGLGEMYYDDSFWELDAQRKVVYYKKLDQEWGIPWNEHQLLGFDKKKLEDISFYPVPFNASLNLKLSAELSGQKHLLLYDLSSRLQLQKKINGSHVKIDTQDLQPGIYFYQLLLPAGDVRTGKLIKVMY